MSITLDNFQAFVPSRIYWRGEEYHAGGAVTNLRKTSGGEWHAKVAGINDYNVHVTIHGNGGLSWSCDCPYNGTMCKHVVATLLAIAKDLAAHLCAAYPRRRAMVEILTPLKK